MGFLLFVFFLLVFIGMLAGGYVVKSIKKFKKAAEQAADKREQQFRDEVGRQRQQYSQRQQPTGHAEQPNGFNGYEQPRQTTTATGETIIDNRHQERESKKIFDDSDGEYVDFVEES
jgi:Flp pilus assembly protein TadG